MASANAIEAGRAVLRVVAVEDGVKVVLDGVVRELESTARNVRNLGVAISAAGLAGLASFLPAINEAARAEEVFSKFSVVFGDAANGVRLWGAALSEAIGRSQTDIAEIAAAFQDLLVPVGFDQGPAREMSKQLTTLAYDLASFNNQTDADTVRDLQAALTGSSETMKKYGVVVNEAAVKQELMNRNLKASDASEVEKVVARLAIIYRQTTAAQGDAVRTAGSLTNVMKDLAGEFKETAEAIGRALLPIVTPLAKAFAFTVDAVGRLVETFPGLATVAGGAAVGMAVLGAAIAGLATAALSVLSPISLVVIGIRLLNSAALEYLGINLILRAATWGWTLALRALSIAMAGVRAATAFLLSNPLVLGLTVITAAVVALSAAFSQTTDTVQRFRDEVNSTETASAIAESAQEAVDALEAMSRQLALSEGEQREADNILNKLGETYNTFGIAVDKATGRIRVQAGAFAKLRNEIAGAAKSDIESQITEEEKRLAELKKEAARPITGDRADAAEFEAVLGAAGLSESQLRQIQADIEATEQKLSTLRNELLNISEVPVPLGTGDFNGSASAAVDVYVREFEESLRESNRRLADEFLANQRRILQVESQSRYDAIDAELRASLRGRDLELALLEEQKQREIAAAEEIGAAKLDVERKFAAQRKEINQRYDEEGVRKAERESEKQDREDNKRRREFLARARQSTIQGTLATRVAGQQFGGGSEQIQRDQLGELKRMRTTLTRIERRQGGLRAI